MCRSKSANAEKGLNMNNSTIIFSNFMNSGGNNLGGVIIAGMLGLATFGGIIGYNAMPKRAEFKDITPQYTELTEKISEAQANYNKALLNSADFATIQKLALEANSLIQQRDSLENGLVSQ